MPPKPRDKAADKAWLQSLQPGDPVTVLVRQGTNSDFRRFPALVRSVTKRVVRTGISTGEFSKATGHNADHWTAHTRIDQPTAAEVLVLQRSFLCTQLSAQNLTPAQVKAIAKIAKIELKPKLPND